MGKTADRAPSFILSGLLSPGKVARQIKLRPASAGFSARRWGPATPGEARMASGAGAVIDYV